MGRVPGAPTRDASFQLSCLYWDIEETGRDLGAFFWVWVEPHQGSVPEVCSPHPLCLVISWPKTSSVQGKKRKSTIFQSGDREEFLGLMENSARKQQREDFSSHEQKQFPDLGKGSLSSCASQHRGFGVWQFLDIAHEVLGFYRVGEGSAFPSAQALASPGYLEGFPRPI